MRKYIDKIILVLILIITLVRCEYTKIECGYNGVTIQFLNDQEASIRQLESHYFLYIDEGIVTHSPNLFDTIYSLLPCNLPDEFKVNNQLVIISGEIKENPGFSSHHNYTDFFINNISKY